ncbi:MAG: hypothetical protein A2Y63_02315 [Candidatus Riflebacteria bacterium RBG_13_59_9]|nr:MAG: hypothetical protein A2Y63_02315 [Candidatus Riflebacteria bacterium RBG_13_59_9]
MHAILSILVIILVAALVAIFGDRMGRLAAKRRVALFGMRPRVAAAWIAVLTGVVIAFATLGFLTLISRDAREMLFHFDELKQNLKLFEKDVRDLEHNRSVLLEDKRELESGLETARTELTEKESEASLLVEEITSGEQRRTKLARELTGAEERLRALEELLATDKQRLDELRAELKKETIVNERLREERATLQEQVDALANMKTSLLAEAAELEERIEALRAGNIAVEANEPLEYVSIPAQMTLPESQKRIITSLNELRLRLEAEGLSLKPVPASALTEILDTLSLLTEDIIVIVYSARNVLPGETVEVTFELAFDKLVFHRGELIARINIAADVGQEQLPDLFANVFAAIRAVALSHGMLPDIATGDVGSISAGDIAKVAEQIEAVPGKRILEIRAGRDFRTTDTLNAFEFVVKRS